MRIIAQVCPPLRFELLLALLDVDLAHPNVPPVLLGGLLGRGFDSVWVERYLISRLRRRINLI